MIHILGIRHHGPGSSRNVKTFLEVLKPDIVLVEGPPEADSLLQWVGHEQLRPPVALLVYQPDDLKQSVFYPFADFSPEWQAIQYARHNGIPARLMDLPTAHQFALATRKQAATAATTVPEPAVPAASPLTETEAETGTTVPADDPGSAAAPPDFSILPHYPDPVTCLAEAAGFSDGEKWWEQVFEHRQRQEQVFEAVAEAMTALREVLPQKDDELEQLREAWMRKMIRQAEREMYTTIAVVCGAWHAPALQQLKRFKGDNELLKGLPKVKTESTWIPWTYQRLSYFSGYGAGIQSPGWYQHVWQFPADDGTRWMANVAKLFREKGMDTSVAHVMEAVRLANALASLRGISKAGLEELNEAALSILCNGEPLLLQLIHDELIVGNTIGEVPEQIPKPPLQADIEKQQKRLRLPATADWKDYTLDLRKETDLERSILLHRLQLLNLPWGRKTEIAGKGTFKEQWRLQWEPEFSVEIIEKGSWGNTVEEAAERFVVDRAAASTHLQEVSTLLEAAIPAALQQAVAVLIQQVSNLAATGSDVVQLMEVIPGLVRITRYGNVRQTDAGLVAGIVQSMMVRIFTALPAACTGVDDTAAVRLLDLFYELNDAINLLQDADLARQWQQALQRIAAGNGTAPMIAGYATRLLADRKQLEGPMLVNAFGLAMNTATEPAAAAAWLEGFLKGSGTLLLLDDELWNTVNGWMSRLDEAVFIQLLPLLRRTFAHFSGPERRKLGEKAKNGSTTAANRVVAAPVAEERGKMGISIVMELIMPVQAG